ncbi:hypothetical protein EUGRSUZ_G00838 [Eucalyptus grandis]|uniref:Uncharacterized protein n=2 Tax=Eucalyptus grandis TaxID=71139 RepID=A0ACC3K139_EUCGR|nr:hypothetical protein EUGRSUZ_G00838 [Eucalyptus grandis]
MTPLLLPDLPCLQLEARSHLPAVIPSSGRPIVAAGRWVSDSNPRRCYCFFPTEQESSRICSPAPRAAVCQPRALAPTRNAAHAAPISEPPPLHAAQTFFPSDTHSPMPILCHNMTLPPAQLVVC